jgi:hypothetical protein
VDSIATGAGDDRIEALDGRRDRVNCGRGKNDSVTSDKFDTVTHCEHRTHMAP